jgi:hypothetical protein
MSRGSKGPVDRSKDRHFDEFRHPTVIEQGGLLRLSGAFLLDHTEELINLIKHEGSLAEARNPLHKVNNIEKAGGGIVAQISDHNLALHIGKALVHAYKGEHNYKFTKDEKFVEVDWKRD